MRLLLWGCTYSHVAHATLVGAISDISNKHRNHTSHSINRNSKQLRLGRSVSGSQYQLVFTSKVSTKKQNLPHIPNNSRQKQRKSVERHITPHIDNHAQPHLIIHKRLLNSQFGEALVLVGGLLVCPETPDYADGTVTLLVCVRCTCCFPNVGSYRDLWRKRNRDLLRVGQKLRIIREIMHHIKTRNPKNDRHNPLKDEDPRPPRLPSHTLHLRNRSSQQPPKRSRNCCGREEDSHTDSEFRALVPAGQIICNSRKQPRLCDSKEPACDKETLIIMHQSHERHNHAPEYHYYGNKNTRSHPLQQDISDGLKKGVGDEEDGEGEIILLAVHA